MKILCLGRIASQETSQHLCADPSDAGRARGLGLVLLLNAIFGGLWVSFLRQLSPYDDTRRKFVNDGGSEHTSELHDGEAPPARLPEKGLVVHVFASDTVSARAAPSP